MVDVNTPIFVASVQEFMDEPSNHGFKHVSMGTILTGLHILTVCDSVTDMDMDDGVFIIKWPQNYIVVADITDLAAVGEIRNVTNIFPSKNCGGRPRIVNLAILKLNKPWDPVSKFGIAPLGIDPDRSYYDYLMKMKSVKVEDCYAFSWIDRKNVEADFEPYGGTIILKRKFISLQDLKRCYPFEIKKNGTNTTVPRPNPSVDSDKYCGMSSTPNDCGIDKGAPLICKSNQQKGDVFLAAIGLGGTKCLSSTGNVYLFQGFQESLPLLRFYLALDEAHPIRRSNSDDGRRSLFYDEDYDDEYEDDEDD